MLGLLVHWGVVVTWDYTRRWKMEDGSESASLQARYYFATHAVYVLTSQNSMLTRTIPSTAHTAHDQAFDSGKVTKPQYFQTHTTQTQSVSYLTQISHHHNPTLSISLTMFGRIPQRLIHAPSEHILGHGWDAFFRQCHNLLSAHFFSLIGFHSPPRRYAWVGFHQRLCCVCGDDLWGSAWRVKQ